MTGRISWRGVVVCIEIALLGAAWAAPARAEDPPLPIVFVHGGAGSAAQYETQAMRFASNGYPNVVTGIDRTSSTPAELNPMLDAFFDAVMARTGDRQIYVVAHSLGTTLMVSYLNSSPQRSARVAKYVNIDGAVGATCPGTPTPVSCLGIFAQGNQSRAMGSNNVRFPQFSHTQSVTAAESFVAQYRFLAGKEPRTTLVLPEPPGQVRIGGRAIHFPANTGLAGSTLQIWEVDPATGVRTYASPLATVPIGPSGEFGPIPVNGQKHYEMTLLRDDVDYVQHHYFQPFPRSDGLLRLLASPPGAATIANAPRGPDHANAVVIRYREWWADQEEGSDALWVTTRSPAWASHPQAPGTVNVLQDPASAPRGEVVFAAGNKIGIHLHDVGADRVSTLAPNPLYTAVTFQTGVDVWMPATTPPDGTISFVNAPRGDASRPQSLHVPNWASDGHRISIQFRDWVQDVNTWGECKRLKPSPCG